MLGQNADCNGLKRMASGDLTVCRTQSFDAFGQKARAPVKKIYGEEIRSAGNEQATIIRHGETIADIAPYRQTRRCIAPLILSLSKDGLMHPTCLLACYLSPQETSYLGHERVELVVVHPVTGFLDQGDARVLEVRRAAVFFGVRRPAVRAIDEQSRAGNGGP